MRRLACTVATFGVIGVIGGPFAGVGAISQLQAQESTQPQAPQTDGAASASEDEVFIEAPAGEAEEPETESEEKEFILEKDDESPASAEDVILPEVIVETSADDEPSVDEDPLYVPVGTEKIKKDELEKHQVRQLSDALQWMVSASPIDTAGGGSAMIVDGLPAAQLQVTQHGMPISRPVGGPDGPAVDLDSIQLSGAAVDSVTVRRGLGTPGSGPASGVVVELNPSPQPRGWSAGMQSSMTLLPGQLSADDNAADPGFPPRAMLGAEAGYGSDALSIRLNGGYQNRAGLDVDRDGAIDSADQRHYQIGARSEWRPTGSNRDSLLLNLNYQDMRTEGVFGPTSVMRDVIQTERVAAQLTGKWQIAEGTRLTHATQFDDYQHRFSKRVLSSGYERLKADTGQIRVTQDVLVERLFGRHLAGVEVYGAVERVARTGETGDLPEVDRLDAGLGLSDVWMPTQTLEVSGRLWAGIHSEFDFDLMADLASQWQVADALVLRGSASRSRRLPTAEELYLFFDHSEIGYQINGNPNLLPEELWSGRAGFDVLLDDKNIQLSFDGFYHRLNNLITTVIDEDAPGRVAQYGYANIDRAQTAGLNAGFRARKLLWGVGVRANYSWLPLAEDIETGERLSLRTYHQLLFELSRKWSKDRVETSAYLRARTPLATPQGSPDAPAVGMLGARVSYQPVAGLRIGLNADNLLDQTDATWGPKAGFSLLGHVAYQFSSTEDKPEQQLAASR